MRRNGTNGELLFDSSAASLVFEDQFVRLRTSLPTNPNLYGTGEHTDPFRLNTTDYTRIIWNRDAYATPPGTNLYGDHPIHFDHRGAAGTHGVFLLNSNGKNVIVNQTNPESDTDKGQYLEYALLGGVLDFYFLAGPSPVAVAQQYSAVAGLPAMMPYWGFGFHQCRYGMRDVFEVAEVVANYSAANIPLETMWTDIDYMYLRRVFSLDPLRFPLDLMRQLVATLHARQQHYVVMVDPAVAYQDYAPFNAGKDADVFYKRPTDGSIYQGVVWPGVTAYPDWFHPNTQGYWDGQFKEFFAPDTGVDIDALWIDMNEASNFCNYPCTDPFAEARQMGNPPRPPPVRIGAPRAIEGFPETFQPRCHAQASFEVYAETRYGENIFIVGDALTLGDGDMSNAVALNADSYPIWKVANVDLPADQTISYQYVRIETDGSYVFEAENRTLTTGGCGSIVPTRNESITTSTPPQTKRASWLSLAADTIVGSVSPHSRRQTSSPPGAKLGLPGRDLINPVYNIHNAAGSLSNKTLDTDLLDYTGQAVYDTHNLYGAQMSSASRDAMLARRPSLRPLIITRSTFAGSGRTVGHWLGDNAADWAHYLYSIKETLEFAALYQVPMVGADVCGFAGNTNPILCARWAQLGAFTPFYRNHGDEVSIPHEFYRWPVVAEAARNALAIRYRLLDYLYTAMARQSRDGTPAVQPMFFAFPDAQGQDAVTIASLEHQFFFGPGVLVAPATVENATTSSYYLPAGGVVYDFYTHEKKTSEAGEWVQLDDVPYTHIPLFYKGGAIVVERKEGANTTEELRKLPFRVVVALDQEGKAEGELYLDDGVSLVQEKESWIRFVYEGGKLSTSGQFGYDPAVVIEEVIVLGQEGEGQSGGQGGQGQGQWSGGGHGDGAHGHAAGGHWAPGSSGGWGRISHKNEGRDEGTKVSIPLTEPWSGMV